MLAELIANNIQKAETNNWYPGQVSKLARYTLLDLIEHQPSLPFEPAVGQVSQAQLI